MITIAVFLSLIAVVKLNIKNIKILQKDCSDHTYSDLFDNTVKNNFY